VFKRNKILSVIVGIVAILGIASFMVPSNALTATAKTTIELWLNKPQAKVNGETRWIDDTNHSVTPISKWGRTLLPVRFISENFGLVTLWDAKESKVTVMQGGELAGTISEAGSTSVLPLAEKFALAFMKKHPKVRISYTGGGTGAGIKQSAGGTVDIGAASRDLKISEPDLMVHAIARDGVAIIVNKGIGITGLTIDQLGKIYAGQVTDWKDVGGKSGKINVYTREEGSGTRDTFQSMVLDPAGLKMSPACLAKKSNGEIQMSVQSDPNGIGYVSFGYTEGVKGLLLNGKEPTIENVKNGSYPISRRLYFLTKHNDNLLVQAFIAFCRSDEGQKIVSQEGYIQLAD